MSSAFKKSLPLKSLKFQGFFMFSYKSFVIFKIFTGLFFMLWRDTPSEKNGLWKLPNVYLPFKYAAQIRKKKKNIKEMSRFNS